MGTFRRTSKSIRSGKCGRAITLTHYPQPRHRGLSPTHDRPGVEDAYPEQRVSAFRRLPSGSPPVGRSARFECRPAPPPSPQPPSKRKNCWLGTPSFSATTTTPIFEIEMGKTYQIQIKLILLWTSATRLSASSCILLFSHFLCCFRKSQLFSSFFYCGHNFEFSLKSQN